MNGLFRHANSITKKRIEKLRNDAQVAVAFSNSGEKTQHQPVAKFQRNGLIFAQTPVFSGQD